MRIVNNLIQNVIAHSHADKIKIVLSKKENNMELLLADTGVGIEKDDLKHIFEPVSYTHLDVYKRQRVPVVGDNDFIESGYTKIKGQLTLPISNSDITDDNGNADVGEIKGDKIYDLSLIHISS